MFISFVLADSYLDWLQTASSVLPFGGIIPILVQFSKPLQCCFDMSCPVEFRGESGTCAIHTVLGDPLAL